MKIKAEQLTRTLENHSIELLWLAGDEPLLIQEAADQVREHYRNKGFDEREVLDVDNKFNWDKFSQTTSNLSLFSEKKIIELRVSSAKLEDTGRKALHTYLAKPNPDFFIFIISPKLDSSTLTTKWFKKIESHGTLVQIWPINRNGLGAWLTQRLLREGINADSEALELLIDKVEGNLLAATQEIEKLKLLANKDSKNNITLDANTVMQVVADSSRYNVYHLVDAALIGDAVRSQKILCTLRAEGLFPLQILAAITRELRSLLPLVEKREQGQGINSIMQTSHVWFNRKQAVGAALGRIKTTDIWHLLEHAGRVDQSVKGITGANAWDELSLLLLAICGQSTATMIKIAYAE